MSSDPALWGYDPSDLECFDSSGSGSKKKRQRPEEDDGSPNPVRKPPLLVERAKSGRSTCRKCGSLIAEGSSRIGVIERKGSRPANYAWHHPHCAFGVPADVLEDDLVEGMREVSEQAPVPAVVPSPTKKKTNRGGGGGGSSR
jgi:hypothetical protein